MSHELCERAVNHHALRQFKGRRLKRRKNRCVARRWLHRPRYRRSRARHLIQLAPRQALCKHRVVAFKGTEVLVIAINPLLSVLLNRKQPISLVPRLVHVIARPNHHHRAQQRKPREQKQPRRVKAISRLALRSRHSSNIGLAPAPRAKLPAAPPVTPSPSRRIIPSPPVPASLRFVRVRCKSLVGPFAGVGGLVDYL